MSATIVISFSLFAMLFFLRPARRGFVGFLTGETSFCFSFADEAVAGGYKIFKSFRGLRLKSTTPSFTWSFRSCVRMSDDEIKSTELPYSLNNNLGSYLLHFYIIFIAYNIIYCTLYCL